MEPIAHIESPYTTKFGIPRQSGIVDTIESHIVFEPAYRIAEALRGIEDYEYLWLIWLFSAADTWSPTVRPPRLGGNRRVGVFATRSPFRPNHIGLSSVRLLRVEHTASLGNILVVSGADLMNGTPILDIKPYLPYTDSHPYAKSAFATVAANHLLQVVIPDNIIDRIQESHRESLINILAHDPRPQYHDDPSRIYGISLWNYEIKFTVDGSTLTVTSAATQHKTTTETPIKH